MVRFLFWNVFGPKLSAGDPRFGRIEALLKNVIRLRKIDVLIIAESPFSGMLRLPELTQATVSIPRNRTTKCYLELFFRDSTVTASEVGAVGRTTLQRLSVTSTGNSILLVASHLLSPGRADQEELRKELVRDLAAEIVSVEKQQNLFRTVIVGDLNYNPFDVPVIASTGLMAVPSRELAITRHHKVRQKSYSFLYNPMWSHLGDRSGTPPGTYFRRSSAPDCRFWHMLDQVLLRPDLIPFWEDKSLQVLTRIGSTNLLTTGGVPDKDLISDHLPLFFKIDL